MVSASAPSAASSPPVSRSGRRHATTSRPSASPASQASRGAAERRSASTGDLMLDPHGRVILISGANRGIGFAVAEALYAKGYTVSLGVRDPGRLQDAIAHW